MKQKLLYSILLLIPVVANSQIASFKIYPFLNGVTSIKEGFLEAGPELKWNSPSNSALVVKPFIRIPLTNKNENTVQIDRFTSNWRSALSLQYIIDKAGPIGPIKRTLFEFQSEYGYTRFKYFPTGNKNVERKEANHSQAFEVKYIRFVTKGRSHAKQYSPQFRVRFSKEWKASEEVGVVNAANGSGIITTTNLIIEKPFLTPIFSPAFSFQYYNGDGELSYAPTIYYDFFGKKGGDNPFNNLSRIRFEYWIFYYPIVKENANVKVGLTPFLSIRTKGIDKFNKAEYGAQISVKFSTNFLQFL